MFETNTIIKRALKLFLCILICLITAFGVRYFYSFAKNYFVADYDFSTYERGPNIGETITLSGLVDKNGKSFSNTKHEKLILIGIVDPECGACKVAKDQITWIHDGIQNSGVEYILVSFTSRTPSEEFSTYTDSFNLPSNSFLWKDSSNPPPDSLLTMVVPSHFLIDTDGKILRKFPGTSNESSVRKRMANQILKEVYEEKKRFDAATK